jgi:hypothetical protein
LNNVQNGHFYGRRYSKSVAGFGRGFRVLRFLGFEESIKVLRFVGIKVSSR